MKRLIALMCCAVLTGTLAACAGNGGTGGATDTAGGTMAPVTADKTLKPSIYTDADFDTSGDIAIETEYEVYGSDAPWVSYTITNRTTDEQVYGVPFSVEVKQNDAWYQVPFPEEETAWITIGIILKPNGINADSFSFSQLDYNFPDGQYRLIKEIDGKRYFAEFQIGTSPITSETPFGYQALEKLSKEYSTEAAAANNDVVIGYAGTVNAEKLTEFVTKASLGMAAMVRTVQFTEEGDPIITDIIYNENGSGYYLYRQDNSRDKFGGTGTGITQTIYSYLITDGERLYLSNCASWDLIISYPNGITVQIAPGLGPGEMTGLIDIVRKLTEKRLEGSVTQFKVYAPGGGKAVSFIGYMDTEGVNGKLSYGYEEPSSGGMRLVSDPDGIATRIVDAFWLDDTSFVLVCDTSKSGLMYFMVGGAAADRSGYGAGYSIADGQFEITK